MHLDGSTRAEIMRTAFKLLNTRIRIVDKSYLYTDTRFAVILPQTGHEGALVLGEKLIQTLAGNMILRNDGVDLSISVDAGMAVFPSDAASSEALLHRAEASLNQAIRTGANKIETASSMVGGSQSNGRDINDLIVRIKKTGS